MIDYDKRRAAGYVAARLEYDDGTALSGLIRLVNYSVALEEQIAQQGGRIQELEEALREARVTLHEILSGQEDSPLASWDVVENIDAALSPSEPRKEE